MRSVCLALVGAVLIAPAASYAGDLRYRPVNPGFGGFPGNYDYLFGTAQAQNDHTRPSTGGGGGGAPSIVFPPISIDLGGAENTQNAQNEPAQTNTTSN